MIQLLAAVLVVLFGVGVCAFVGVAAKKPYDGFDIWTCLIGGALALVGIGRTVWLAFN